jgi:carbohydrate-selective porin OprB
MAVVGSTGFIIAAQAGEISPLSPQTRSSLASIWTAPTFTGDWSGLRTRLADEGITFNVQYAAEVWSNVTGGESTGTVYTGLMTLQGNVDLQKLVGWQGASVSTRWYWLSGQDISATNLGNNIFTISNIAGFPTFRMNELWFQQNFLSNRISIRLGQWRSIPSSVSPPMRLSFSMERLHGHPISIQTSKMGALHILWVCRVCNWRLRL